MTSQTTFINRIDTENGIEFDKLRNEGIQLLQELSGNIWTDYNAHDPGVTILEQLIYALTEFQYLLDFDVKDFFTNSDDEIPYKDLALYNPIEIYPSETITTTDYRKKIFDTIKGVRNVWNISTDEQKGKGLYCFLIDIAYDDRDQKDDIERKIRKYYNAHRNLCEDIAEIKFLKREAFEVCASIDINNHKTPEEILAEIYFACFKHISPRMTYSSFHECYSNNLSIDEILSGPALSKGFIKDEEMPTLHPQVFVSDIMKVIFQIDGVESINDIFFLQDGKKYTTSIDFMDHTIAGFIKLPQTAPDIKVHLFRNERKCTINLAAVFRKFYNSYHAYKEIYNTRLYLEEDLELQKGKYIQFDDYYSVQNQFPAIYGINEYGIPDSATPARKAQAKQLKAYLLLFEQVLMNGLTQMEHIKNLFSIDQKEHITYYTKTLTNIPDINDILPHEWVENKELHQKELQAIIAKYDDYYKRKNKFLDFVLAMYGEKFSYRTYQQFNYFHSEQELPGIICANKIKMLKNLVKINRHKARSFNYLKTAKDKYNIPMIKMKISLLLGINDYSHRTYSDVLANHHLQFTEKEEGFIFNFIEKIRNDSDNELDNQYIDESFEKIRKFSITEWQTDSDDLKTLYANIDIIENGYIHEDIFRYGNNIAYYRIGKLKNRDVHSVVFQHAKSEQYIHIGDFADKESGVLHCNKICWLLQKLNIESEGMHIVEHILLGHNNNAYDSVYEVVDDNNDRIFSSTPKLVLEEEASAEHIIAHILTDINNYRTEFDPLRGYCIDIFQEGAKVMQSSAYYASRFDAELAAERYNGYFRALNELTLIEQQIRPIKHNTIPNEFFPFRISVVLPAWSARFNNERFRKFVEESFMLNLPAHIYPEFYWLNLSQMHQFEHLFFNWLDIMQKKQDNDELDSKQKNKEEDEYADRLIKFLIDHRPVTASHND